MTVNLTPLSKAPRALFRITLEPLQGRRFQPTGFPGLGAATFETRGGTSVLVESAQSLANRLEAVCWDDAEKAPRKTLDGISYVRVLRHKKYLTSSLTESHRLNSPYILEGKKDKTFFDKLKQELVALDEGPIDRGILGRTLLKYDVMSLLHGIFLAKKELAGGRLRVARALSAFVEADGARVAASGGVKNDHVNPSGNAKEGFGNVPFARDEFTADQITLYVNLDLAQIRGYGLGAKVENLLVLLALFKLRALLGGSLRFRTACDLMVKTAEPIRADAPEGFELPSLDVLEAELPKAINACKADMVVTEVTYDDDLKKGKDKEDEADGDDDPNGEH
ncbi:type I-U CRISPR-associated protein Cas7 [bacterium]|nr:type I-U CRISPR-associated protein Cas7 [bacterium]